MSWKVSAEILHLTNLVNYNGFLVNSCEMADHYSL